MPDASAGRLPTVWLLLHYLRQHHTRTPKADDTLDTLANEVKSENKTLTLAMPDSILALYTLR